MAEDDDSDGGDDGGDDGNDGGDGGDDDGPILEGRVEKGGDPDDGGDVYVPGDPDGDGDPDGGEGPDGGGDSDGGGNPVTILARAISVIIPTILNAVLTRASQLPNGSGDNDAINRLNTSVETLNNSQDVQKQSIKRLSAKISTTKDKISRERLQKECSKIQNEHYKTQVLVDKINNSVKNKDYERVVKEINAYNNKRNSVYTSNQSTNNQSAPQESNYGGDNNNVLKGSVSTDSSQYNSGKTESNSGSNAPEIPKEVESVGKVLSGSESTAGFLKDLNKIPGIDPYTIKKTLGVYDSPMGRQIQTQYEKEIQAGVEKIAKECIDGAKAVKIATEIAEKVAPVLTCAVILQQVIEGYQKGGVPDAILRGGIEYLKTFIFSSIFEVLIPLLNGSILTAAGFTVLIELVINFIFDKLLNHIKL